MFHVLLARPFDSSFGISEWASDNWIMFWPCSCSHNDNCTMYMLAFINKNHIRSTYFAPRSDFVSVCLAACVCVRACVHNVRAGYHFTIYLPCTFLCMLYSLSQQVHQSMCLCVYSIGLYCFYFTTLWLKCADIAARIVLFSLSNSSYFSVSFNLPVLVFGL